MIVLKNSLSRGQMQDKCVENSEAEFVRKKNSEVNFVAEER